MNTPLVSVHQFCTNPMFWYLQLHETLGSKQFLILWDKRRDGWIINSFPGHWERQDLAKTDNLVYTSSKSRCVISVLLLVGISKTAAESTCLMTQEFCCSGELKYGSCVSSAGALTIVFYIFFLLFLYMLLIVHEVGCIYAYISCFVSILPCNQLCFYRES